MRQQPDCDERLDEAAGAAQAELALSAPSQEGAKRGSSAVEVLQPAQQQPMQPMQPQQQNPQQAAERRKAPQAQPTARKRRKSLEQQQNLRRGGGGRPAGESGQAGALQQVVGSQSQSRASGAECGPAGAPAGPLGDSDNICAACLKPIRERYLLVALDKQWHEDCLKCACCDCRLGEVGSSLFTHSDKILCRRDFLRIFGQHGHCAACKKSIPPYEMVMRANDNAYHMDCFACQQCQYRFCVGDRFHLTERLRIVCVLCHSDSQQQQQHSQHSQPQPNPNQQRQEHQDEPTAPKVAANPQASKQPAQALAAAGQLEQLGQQQRQCSGGGGGPFGANQEPPVAKACGAM